MPTDSSRPPSNRREGQSDAIRELDENPYATSNAGSLDSILPPMNRTEASFVTTFLTWTVVCGLSAAPSFFWAISEVAKDQANAMILGVVSFIGIYTAVDILSRDMPFRQNSRMRSILRATFIVRSVMVVIFPVALTTDLFLGLISVNFVGFVLKPLEPAMQKGMSFGIAYATTLVQGCLLSVFLFFLGLLISAIVFLIRSLAGNASR
jgi:hypothetical protein